MAIDREDYAREGIVMRREGFAFIVFFFRFWLSLVRLIAWNSILFCVSPRYGKMIIAEFRSECFWSSVLQLCLSASVHFHFCCSLFAEVLIGGSIRWAKVNASEVQRRITGRNKLKCSVRMARISIKNKFVFIISCHLFGSASYTTFFSVAMFWFQYNIIDFTRWGTRLGINSHKNY